MAAMVMSQRMAVGVALNWGSGTCSLHLTTTAVYGHPHLAGGGRPRPSLTFCPELHVCRFHEDGCPRACEFYDLPLRQTEASNLVIVPCAPEALLFDVTSSLECCTGLPEEARDCVARTMLAHVQNMAAWALQAGASPTLLQIHAAINVRVISEQEVVHDDGWEDLGQMADHYGESLSWVPWVPWEQEDGHDAYWEDVVVIMEEDPWQTDSYGEWLPPVWTAAMDDQLAGGGGDPDTGRGEEEEEEEEVVVEGESCSICLKRMGGRRKTRWLPCLHQFHDDCVRRWLQHKAQCPLCRFQVA